MSGRKKGMGLFFLGIKFGRQSKLGPKLLGAKGKVGKIRKRRRENFLVSRAVKINPKLVFPVGPFLPKAKKRQRVLAYADSFPVLASLPSTPIII